MKTLLVKVRKLSDEEGNAPYDESIHVFKEPTVEGVAASLDNHLLITGSKMLVGLWGLALYSAIIGRVSSIEFFDDMIIHDITGRDCMELQDAIDFSTLEQLDPDWDMEISFKLEVTYNDWEISDEAARTIMGCSPVRVIRGGGS